jgi:hypothetical protein
VTLSAGLGSSAVLEPDHGALLSPLSSRQRGSRGLSITRQGERIPARSGFQLANSEASPPWRRNAGSKRSTNKYYCASDEGAKRRRRAATSVLGKRVPLDALSGAVKLFFRPACSYCTQSPWIKFSSAHFRCNCLSISASKAQKQRRSPYVTALAHHLQGTTQHHSHRLSDQAPPKQPPF